jgi:protein-tyrosine phosphatase
MRATVYWVEGPWRGRLAILPRPRGGDWLEDEILAWRQAGIQLVVSTLTPEEIGELDIAREQELCEANGIRFLAFPITDRGVPVSSGAAVDLVRRLERCLTEGTTVAVHCRQGVGRSALLAACLLVAAGIDPAAAFTRIQDARGCPVPDTAEQREWVARFARDFLAASPGGSKGGPGSGRTTRPVS